MYIAKVIGKVVITPKHPSFAGFKLLYIQPLITRDGKLSPSGSSIVAVDCVNCGEGSLVMFTQGSSARMTDCTRDSPVDAVIVGIVDSVEVEGKTLSL
jgi:ethanolamine utilization protein EutN